MGIEVRCRVVIDGERSERKVLLETDEVLVAGTPRVKIPFRDVSSIDVEPNALTIRWSGREAHLSVGSGAAAWADKIRNPKPLTAKLGIRSGQRITVLGKVDEGFLTSIEALGADLSRHTRTATDLLFFAADRRSDLDRLDELKSTLTSAGAIWILRPKGGSAITESDVMQAARRAGLVDVKVARFSESHAAEKLVIPKAQR
jgi:hypothetical protein